LISIGKSLQKEIQKNIEKFSLSHISTKELDEAKKKINEKDKTILELERIVEAMNTQEPMQKLPSQQINIEVSSAAEVSQRLGNYVLFFFIQS
jgi:hypothetical protein